MTDQPLRGVRFHPIPENNTVIIEVTSPRVFKPVLTGVTLLHAIQKSHSASKLWRCKGVRPEFFDALYGGTSVRTSLQKGYSPKRIASSWRRVSDRFRRQRQALLLYKRSRIGS